MLDECSVHLATSIADIVLYSGFWFVLMSFPKREVLSIREIGWGSFLPLLLRFQLWSAVSGLQPNVVAPLSENLTGLPWWETFSRDWTACGSIVM